jgi:hypothetical protein
MDCTRAKDELATERIRRLRKNLRMHHEGKWGTKDLGSKRPLHVRKKRETMIGIGGGAQNNYHLWEEEYWPTRSSRRPLLTYLLMELSPS